MDRENIIELSGLEQMDVGEVKYIMGLVSGLFGEFHEDVVIDGVYFYEKRHPTTVYPPPYNQFDVAICLPVHQAENPLARLVHLSHELVHCLTPNGLPSFQATKLEEGLAEHAKIYLSEALYREEYPDYDFKDMLKEEYLAAFDLVENLIEFEGLEGMRQSVRNMRKQTGMPFASISADHMSQHFGNSPRSLLCELCSPFH